MLTPLAETGDPKCLDLDLFGKAGNESCRLVVHINMRQLTFVLVVIALLALGYRAFHKTTVHLDGVGLETTAADMARLGFASHLDGGLDTWSKKGSGTIATGPAGAFVNVRSDQFTVYGVTLSQGSSEQAVRELLGPPDHVWESYWAYPRLNLHVKVEKGKMTGALLLGKET